MTSQIKTMQFESFVNSERCKTLDRINTSMYGLRALLIQKDVKPGIIRVSPGRFESFVNSERCKTDLALLNVDIVFESFVNSERCKTTNLLCV